MKLLKQLFAIHSPSGREQKMINFLISHIKSLPGNIQLGKDKFGNLYAVKGSAENYPCLVSHLDQVQQTHSKDFRAIETRDIIFGFSPKNKQFEGLGADDAVGIWIALQCLAKYDHIKVAFFREEEIGCRGSEQAEMSFFADCAYVIQCDRKGNSDIVTNISVTDLCSAEFIEAILPEQWGYKDCSGLMTDVLALKENGLGVSAINLSCGYWNPHTDEEIVVKRDVLKCLRFVEHIIDTCGSKAFPHTPQTDYFGNYWEYEFEDEIYDILLNAPTLTADDLYDMYHTNYPLLRRADFERMVGEFRSIYGIEEEEEYNFDNIKLDNDYGKKENNTRSQIKKATDGAFIW